MALELKVPSLGESVAEVEIGDWLKSEGDEVQEDDPVVVLESEKATVELPAPKAGVISKIVKKKGEKASVGDVIGFLEEGEAKGKSREEPEEEAEEEGAEEEKESPREERARREAREGEEPGEKEAGKEKGEKEKETERGEKVRELRRGEKEEKRKKGTEEREEAPAETRVMPAARRALAEHGLEAEDVKASGPGGRLLKEDVMRHVESREKGKAREEKPRPPAEEGREEEVVPMSLLRRRIAERLVEAQRNQAQLTTFNEIDMSEVMALRERYGKSFEEEHRIRLGIMSFFVKASIEALKLVPQVNAEIRGSDIVYRNYYDIGVAVGGGRGLVVPVLRNAERRSFAEIESAIHDFARRARENKLNPDELRGGTFTITNGGVYGSLLSTPIINPPQSGILGMHAIQDRPVAREGQLAIRPMMYVALTYDHRIVDGREAVTFLKRIKECVEAPSRILLET